MRCLRPDPEARPASALAVAALLPGGDPLAAALAAGQTPSPEMVAAAGSNEAISARAAFVGAAWIVLSIAAVIVMYQRVMLINRIATPKSPAALQDRAEEALGKIGYGASEGVPHGDKAFGLGISLDYARYLGSTSSEPDRWSHLRGSRPETLVSWYRTSPRALIPFGSENPVTGGNPPLNIAGMTLLVLDASGRLSEFVAVPAPLQEGAVAAPPVDWKILFDTAALDMGRFRAVDPKWVPVTFADQRFAWEGEFAEQPGQTLRVEAASFAGKPVSFVNHRPVEPLGADARCRTTSHTARTIDDRLHIAGPSRVDDRGGGARASQRQARSRGQDGCVSSGRSVVLGARGCVADRRPLGRSAFAGHHTILHGHGTALLDAALLWVTYLAVEPYIRKLSPGSLIGWTRLIGGRWQDPLVARDVLIGVSAGLAMTVVYGLHNLIPPLFGRPEPMPLVLSDTNVLLGARFVLSRMASQFGTALLQGMLSVVGLVALMIPLRRKWATHIVGSLIYVWVVIQGMFNPGYARPRFLHWSRHHRHLYRRHPLRRPARDDCRAGDTLHAAARAADAGFLELACYTGDHLCGRHRCGGARGGICRADSGACQAG